MQRKALQRLPLEHEIGFHQRKLEEHWWVICSRRGDQTGLHLSLPMVPTSYNRMTFRDRTGKLNHWAIPAAEKKKWGEYAIALKRLIHPSYQPERRKLVRFTVLPCRSRMPS